MKQSLACWLFKPLFISLTLAIFLMGNIACADDSGVTSQITSIKDADCSELPIAMTAFYDKRHIDGDECPSQQGWRAFKAFDENISWIDIAYGDALWSTEKIIKNDTSFGLALHITGKQIEWRILKSGAVNALFFHISAVPPMGQNTIQSRFLVISLAGNSPRFCGMAKTVQDARDLADNATTCNTLLPKQSFPGKTKE
jgi:hypothetical protein